MNQKISKAIASFSLTEKFLFSIFAILIVGSTLLILWNINNQFMVTVPVRGGTIQEGIIGYPRLINPLLSYTDAGNDMTTLIYSGLMKATPDGNLVPDLASSYNISNDGLTYDFTLKDNLTFQDGTPLTTDDIEFTVQKALDPVLKSPKAANWEGVTIKKINSKEIQFILSKPYSPFLENTTLGILPKHLWKNIDSDLWSLSSYNQEPIGSGPYYIKDVKRDQNGLYEYYHLTPFSHYALGEPYVGNIIIRFYTNEQDLINAYDSGEINTMGGISSTNASILKNKGADIVTTPLPRTFGIFFNQSQSHVLLNKEVRQALNMSINRQDIVNDVLNGYGIVETGALPSSISGSTLDSSTSSGAVSSSETQDQLISDARALLIKNGWAPDTNGIMEKTTKTGKTSSTQILQFSISTSDSPDLKHTAELVQSIWKKVGADVTVKVFELSDLNQSVIRTRNYDSLLFGTVVGRDLDLFGFWHSSQRNDPGLNIAMYANIKADKLLEDARSTSDMSQRLNDYNLFEKEIDNDIPAVFLYSPDYIYVKPKPLEGIVLGNITVPAERFLNVQSWYKETERVWTIFAK